MKAKKCPNPDCFLLSLLSIISLTLAISYNQEIPLLIRNFYLFLAFVCIVLCVLIFFADNSLASFHEQKPLLRLKMPYNLCETCNLSLFDQAEHCTQCGICIAEFQNHCIFLSTCIGKSNKNIFYLLLFLLQIWCIFNIITSSYSFTQGIL